MPDGSMLKFFQEGGGPNSDHGGNLFWPGTPEGFPYRGESAPNLKQEEAENIPLALDFKSQMFELWDEKQKAAIDAPQAAARRKSKAGTCPPRPTERA